MLDFVQEEKTVWEHLKASTKPIVLYGMGNGADRILDKCIELGIEVVGVFASDEFVRGQTFRCYPVMTYAEAKEKWGDFVIVIAFASESKVVLDRFFELAELHETYAPHVALFHGDELVSREWFQKYEKELQEVYDLWADDKSRAVMRDTLNYKLSGKMEYLKNVTARKEDLETLFTFHDHEVYADLGAYNGDTIEEFINLAGENYDHIYAVEPDKKNFVKLRNFVEEGQIRKCTLVNKGIWSEDTVLRFYQRGGRMSSLSEAGKVEVEVTSIDTLVGGGNLSYVKMDVEGVEKEALEGGQKVISAQGPKLFVAAYHHDNDLWQLPLQIKALNPNYKLMLRRHPYVPCWEMNILAQV